MVTSTYYLETTQTTRRKNYDNTITFFPGQLKSVKNLSSWYSRKGNYVTPNPHYYLSEKYTTYAGSRTLQLADGKTEVLSGVALGGGQNMANKYGLTFASGLYDQAVSNLLEKARGSELNLAEDLVQYRQVMGMLNLRNRAVNLVAHHAKRAIPMSNRAARLERQLSSARSPLVRQRLVKEFDDVLNNASSLHLEYMYGWRPLASSVHELARLAVTPPGGQHLKIEGYAGYRIKSGGSFPNVSGSQIPENIEGTVAEFCRVVCFMTPNPSVVSSLNSVSSINPALIAYTAIPYSFVLDWFVNLGGWMQSFETYLAHKNNFVTGYVLKGKRLAHTHKWNGSAPGGSPAGSKLFSDAMKDTLYNKFERQVLGSLPAQIKPVMSIPGLSPGKCFEAASLIKQLVPLDRLLRLR